MIVTLKSRQTPKAVLALVISGLLGITAGQTQTADAASLNFVAQLNSSITKAKESSRNMRDAAQKLCENLTTTILDIEAMMRTASAGAFDKMDDAQRDGYRAAFIRRVIKDCAVTAADHMQQGVGVAGVRKLPSGEVIVGTRGNASDAAKILMWQLRSKDPGKPAVTDVFFEGRSAMLTLREQAIVALQQNAGEVAAVIDSLER